MFVWPGLRSIPAGHMYRAAGKWQTVRLVGQVAHRREAIVNYKIAGEM